ncbi:hypothetical protein ACFW9L_09910 [Streptomyces sp. NPDC059517]|uniref:hypothetical protein n=1 Tax=Streptomyces sp. NPDC059517 TaxID=3346855 RepID=UPI0036B1131E
MPSSQPCATPFVDQNHGVLVQDVADVWAAEVAADDVRLALPLVEEASGLGGEFGLIESPVLLGQTVLEVGLDQLVGVQLGQGNSGTMALGRRRLLVAEACLDREEDRRNFSCNQPR